MSENRPDTRRLSHLLLSLGLSIATLAGLATAASAARLQEQIAAARADAAALSAASTWKPDAEERLLQQLDGAVTRLRSQGGSARDAAALRELVEGTRQRHEDWLHGHQQAVIAADGDLEALQESEEWRDRERIALQLLYLRNWLYLESATRFDPRSRQKGEWLRKAAEGFALLAGTGDPLIAAESYFGRALCERALGDVHEAIADLRRAQKLQPPPDLAARIGVTLVESQIDAGQIADALRSSSALVAKSTGPEEEFLRAKTLLLALASLRLDASRRQKLRRETADLVTALQRRGGKWPRLARELVAAGVTRPEEWVKDAAGNPTIRRVVADALRAAGKCGEALPLYETIAGGEKNPGDDVLIALGECQYREGRYDAALHTLGRISADSAAESRADAAYLRFKIAEARDRNQGSEQSAAELRSAAEGLLAAFPNHPQAFEARFRLGELDRRQGDLLAAAEQFDAVQGDEQLALQATFQSAQCYAEAWQAQSRSGAEPDDDLAQAALERLRRFLEQARAYRAAHGDRPADEAMLSPLRARARVLGALLLARQDDPGGAAQALDWLHAFDTKFPAQKGLQIQASAVRAAALLDLGRYAEARQAVASFLAAPTHDPRDYEWMKRLGVRALTLLDEPPASDDPNASAALRAIALQSYEELLRGVESGTVQSESPAGLRALIERLRAGES